MSLDVTAVARPMEVPGAVSFFYLLSFAIMRNITVRGQDNMNMRFGGIATALIAVAICLPRLHAQTPRPNVAAEWADLESNSIRFLLAFNESGQSSANGQRRTSSRAFIAARGTKFEIINYDTSPESGKKGRYQVIRNLTSNQDYSIDYSAGKAIGTLLLYPPGRIKGSVTRGDNDFVDLLSLRLSGGVPPSQLVVKDGKTVRVVPGSVANEFGAWKATVQRVGEKSTAVVSVTKGDGNQFIDTDRQNTMSNPGEDWQDRLGAAGRLVKWEEGVTVAIASDGRPEKVEYTLAVATQKASYTAEVSHAVTDVAFDASTVDAKIDALLVPIPDGYTAEVLNDMTAMMWKDGRIVDRIDRRVFDMSKSFWFSSRAKVYRILLAVAPIVVLAVYFGWRRWGKRDVATGTNQ